MEERKILYGDDKKENRSYLEKELGAKNYQVDLVESPDEFISRAQSGNYLALITDLDYTPDGREGFDVLDQIRDIDALKVLYSGVVGFEYQAEAFEHGADYAVLKKNYRALSEILDDELGGKNGF